MGRLSEPDYCKANELRPGDVILYDNRRLTIMAVTAGHMAVRIVYADGDGGILWVRDTARIPLLRRG